MVDGLFSLTIGRGWGREELMSVNCKTVAVLHVVGGGVEFLARAGAGAEQEGGGLLVISCANSFCVLDI